ncbi:unnamed protein product [Cylicocyclus nassatus]|uniref:MAM domain-containing protein n=1 Tax=Cylicocyclus nassatus TaxID=53992 RepID=A0AA36DRS2_CYLNA|nr:unnamed protein product [Cylicocyclus nassatus]
MEVATVYPMSNSLAVSAGGRITCGFDDDREYCSWHNAMDADLNFSKAEWNSFFDQNRFDCSNPRPFYPRNIFLLVKGGPDGVTGKAVLETTIPCQYDSAVIKFDIWSLTNTPVLRFCVSWLNGTGHCENAYDVPNPINITIPHSVEPITVRIEILNINSIDIVLIDSLYYEGQLCELVDEKEQNFVTDPTLLTSSIQPHLSINKITRDADTNEPTVDHATQDWVGTEIIVDGDTRANAVKVDSTALEDDPDIVACEGLTCDFNHNHSCFYKLSGFGSTSPWLIGTSFVGNRHTGVQRLNQDDSNRVGFAYVGRDHADESNEIFVMESPKITISTDANFLFDVYLRSYSPHFKVCVDSFENCLYESPSVSKNAFWIRDNSIVLQKGVRKVYLITTNVRQNQFLAVDRLRLQLSGKPCAVRRL